MQATNNCSNGTRRRRRRLGVCSQFLLAVTAVTVWLCISGIRPTNSADAFVSPLCFSCSDKSSKLRQGVRPKWGASSPETARSHLSHLAPDSISQGHRSARMVIGEPPSAACLRSLQRAWEASSSEATGHLEQQQQQEPSRVTETGDGLNVRLTTFNLLAPCYKRMHKEAMPLPPAIAETGTGLLASQAKTSKNSRTARESEFSGVWKERAMETVDFIRREMSSSDIICLQEFWLDPGYEAIFRSALGDAYDFHTVKRTGEKSDGVAVLLRRGRWDVRSSRGLSLSRVGDRVALVMHLRSLEDGVKNGKDMILVNTHLAFPHSLLDRMNQIAQIKVVTDAVDRFVRDARLPTMTPRVVVGDLNVEESDPVCRHLSSNGFRSAFTSLHRERRVITHFNHRGEQVMVDHVFVKAPGFAGRRRGEAAAAAPEVPGLVARLREDISVEEALLLPRDVESEKWNPDFALSDHRPLSVRLKFPAI